MNKKTTYILLRIGLLITAFVFAFAFFGSVTGKGTWYIFIETVKVMKQLIGL